MSASTTLPMRPAADASVPALGLLAAVASADTPKRFRSAVLGVIDSIPGDSVVFGEVNPDRQSLTTAARPAALEDADLGARLMRLRAEHPVLARWEERGDTTPASVSALTTRRAFRATALSRELYEPLGIVDQLVIPIAAGGAPMAVAVGRSAWGFSAKEQRLAGQLQLVLAIAVAWMREVEIARAGAPILSSIATSKGVQVLLCDRRGAVLDPGGDEADLDPRVVETVRHGASLAFSTQGSVSPGETVLDVSINTGSGTTTGVRVHAPQSGGSVVPVTIERPRPGALREELERHGLTARQVEAMSLILDGATNAGAANAMGISERTVEKHALAAYEKLGARTRTEALLAILR